MRTVKIRSRETDFARMMLEMRTWLDQHRFEPTKFTYEQDREVIVISVEFHRDNDAEAFKNCFDSQQPQLDFALRNEFEPMSRVGGDGSASTESSATMAQACRWRLLAEEIRTEADNFASESAKETMEMAARGWEQLAEELEHRLGRNSGRQLHD